MPYSEIELQSFITVQSMLQEELKTNFLSKDKTAFLRKLLKDPLEIPPNEARLKCYDKLLEFLQSGSDKIKTLTRIAIHMVILITLDHKGRADALYETFILGSKTDFSFVYLSNISNDSIFEAIRQVPHLTSLDLSSNLLLTHTHTNSEYVKAIQHATQITSLNLNYIKLSEWNFEDLMLLTQAIQHAPHLSSLDISSTQLGEWNNKGHVLLTQAIQHAPHLSSINISSNQLDKLDIRGHVLLTQAIQHAPHLTSLNLGFNSMNFLNLECITLLTQAIQHAPHLSSLNLTSIKLSKWDIGCVTLLTQAIQHAPHITELNLSYNSQNSLNLECLTLLTQAIQHAPQLTSLDFSNNSLNSLDLERLTLLTQAIQHAPYLTLLNLSFNSLNSLNLDCITLLTQAIQHAPHLSSLDLSGNQLYEWDIRCHVLLNQAIQHAPHFTSLDISNNEIGGWDIERIKLLIQTIEQTPHLTTLKLGYHNLHNWDNKCKYALENAIAHNLTITSIKTINKLPVEIATNIQTYLKRNESIALEVKHLEDILIKQTPVNSQIDITQDDYDKIAELEVLLNSKTSNPKTPSLQNYLQRLEIIRFEAFQLIWSTTQDFLQALPWCLNANQDLILFKDKQQQKVFDSILAAAVGAKINLDKADSAFSNEQRLTLLKFMMLKNVNGIDHQIKFPVHTSTFFTKEPIIVPINVPSIIDKVAVDVILEQAHVINENYEKLPSNFNAANVSTENFENLVMLRNIITNLEHQLEQLNITPNLKPI